MKIIDTEPQGEATRELVGLDIQVPGPQAHPQAVKGSTNEETARDLGASAAEDGHTPESPALGEPVADGSLMEKDVVAEEPVVEVPPTREGPAVECPASVHSWPPDSQEEDQVEVHTPEEDLDD